MPCKVTMYRLRKTSPIWKTWDSVRKELIATLSHYGHHEIRLTYDEKDMKHALLLRRRAEERKMAADCWRSQDRRE